MVEIPITVSYGTPSQTISATLIAVSESLNDQTGISLVIEGTDKLPSKKTGGK